MPAMAKELLDTPGKRLRAARQMEGYSQKELAEKLGITQSLLSRIELDKNTITTVVVPAAQILEVSTDYLLMQSDERKGEKREGGSQAEEPHEDVNMYILRLAIQDMPDPDRPELLRFLIRQVAVYRDTFSKT